MTNRKPSPKTKLVGSAPTLEGLEAGARKYFYSEAVHFKEVPSTPGQWTVHNSTEPIEGFRVLERRGRFRLEVLL